MLYSYETMHMIFMSSLVYVMSRGNVHVHCHRFDLTFSANSRGTFVALPLFACNER